MSFEDLAIVLTAIAVGSYFKGAVGIGLPTIAVPTLAAFIGAEHAIVVLTIPVAASNVWICWRYRKMTSDVPHLKISLICAGVGTASGAFVLASLSDNALLWLIIVWLLFSPLSLIFSSRERPQDVVHLFSLWSVACARAQLELPAPSLQPGFTLIGCTARHMFSLRP